MVVADAPDLPDTVVFVGLAAETAHAAAASDTVRLVAAEVAAAAVAASSAAVVAAESVGVPAAAVAPALDSAAAAVLNCMSAAVVAAAAAAVGKLLTVAVVLIAVVEQKHWRIACVAGVGAAARFAAARVLTYEPGEVVHRHWGGQRQVHPQLAPQFCSVED